MLGVRTLALGLVVACLWSAPSRANLVTNGSFETGDGTGWSVFTTGNGTLGPPPLPRVTSFDVTGTGATNAGELQVGVAIGSGTQEGGGITQSVTTGAGVIAFHAAIAAFASKAGNLEGGTFTVFLDNTAEASHAFGPIDAGVVDRSALDFSLAVGAGPHALEILITRSFGDGGGLFGETPFELVTDITLDPVAEPTTLAILGLGLAGLGVVRRSKAA